MKTYTFTELQIINIWLSSIQECTTVDENEDIIAIKEHLRSHGIRVETGIHMDVPEKHFFTDQTSQVQEQIPFVKTAVDAMMEKLGYISTDLS